MYSPRFIQLLLVALSATTVTQAAFMDVELFGGVHHEGAVKRQTDLLPTLLTESVTSPTAAASPSTATENSTATTTTEEEEETSTTTTPPTTEETTTTDATTPTSDPTTAPTITTTEDPTTTNETTTTEPAPTTGPTSTTGPIPSVTSETGGSPGTTSSQEPSTTSAPSTTLSSYTSVVTEVTVITTQDESGQQTTFETSTTRTETGAALVTAEPDSSENPGMDENTRNVVIGVTVGVGGAIVLGVAGLLFWRLRNKKRSSEENEDLVSYGNGFGGPGTAEKSETATNPSTQSPFQSTLESYHAPTQTNAASNF